MKRMVRGVMRLWRRCAPSGTWRRAELSLSIEARRDGTSTGGIGRSATKPSGIYRSSCHSHRRADDGFWKLAAGMAQMGSCSQDMVRLYGDRPEPDGSPRYEGASRNSRAQGERIDRKCRRSALLRCELLVGLFLWRPPPHS